MTSFDSSTQHMNSTSSDREADAEETMRYSNGGGFALSLPLRGIYLRPTLFMINGTASRLMDVLYPPGAPLPLFPSAEPAARWGLQSPTAPARWVSFEYTLYNAFPVHEMRGPDFATDAAKRLEGMSSTGFTEDEVIADRAPGAMGERAGRLLMRSLRENRLSAGTWAGVQGHCCRLGEPLEAGRRVSVVIGSGDGTGLHESVLHADIEVALSAMSVGDDVMFVFLYHSAYAEDCVPAYEPYRPELRIIRIKLLDRRLQDPLLSPRLMHKFVVHLPTVEPDEAAADSVYGMIHPFSFFRESMLFHPDLPIFSLHMTTEDVVAFTYTGARHALCTAVSMALGNCLLHGLPPPMAVMRDGTLSASPARLVDAFLTPYCQQQQQKQQEQEQEQEEQEQRSTEEYSGGIPMHNDYRMPTDAAAQAFLRLRFLSTPRDGATVTCRVMNESLLTDERPPARSITNVLLGSTSLPIWMDLTLQSMRPRELDILNVHTGDSDSSFFGHLVSAVREDAVKQIHALDATIRQPAHTGHMPRGMTPPFPSSQKQGENHKDNNTNESLSANAHGLTAMGNTSSASSSLGSTSVACEPCEIVEMEQPIPLPHDFRCRIVMESFQPAYDINSFFFVNPTSAFQAVRTLWEETSALLSEKLGARDAPHHNAEGENEEGVPDDVGRAQGLACACAEEIELQKIPNGCLSCPSTMRFMIKGIQKMNFAVLLLTFNVSDQHPRGSPAVLRTRRAMLAAVFCRLGHLYRAMDSRVLWESALTAYSAAIIFEPENTLAWLSRGGVLAQLHQVERVAQDVQALEAIIEKMKAASETHCTGQAPTPREKDAAEAEGLVEFPIFQCGGFSIENLKNALRGWVCRGGGVQGAQ